MYRLEKEIEAKVKSAAGSAIFRLRRPTSEDLLKHMEMILLLQHHNKLKSLINERCSFFDSLLISVLDLSDVNGNPITVETSSQIPPNWKAYVICRCFEDAEVMLRGNTEEVPRERKIYGIFSPRRPDNQMKRRAFPAFLYAGRTEDEGI